MKQLIYVIAISLFNLNVFAQNYDSARVSLKFNTNKILVVFSKDYPTSKRNRLVYDDRIIPIEENIRNYSNTTIFELKPGLTQNEVENVIASINFIAEVIYAAPVLGHSMQVANQISMVLKNKSDINIFQEKVLKLGLVLRVPTNEAEKNQEQNFDERLIVEIPKSKMDRYFEILENFSSSNLFENVKPIFIQRVSSHPENSRGLD